MQGCSIHQPVHVGDVKVHELQRNDTTLHEAARRGEFERVLQLLKAGATPCTPNEEGLTPLQVACTASQDLQHLHPQMCFLLRLAQTVRSLPQEPSFLSLRQLLHSVVNLLAVEDTPLAAAQLQAYLAALAELDIIGRLVQHVMAVEAARRGDTTPTPQAASSFDAGSQDSRQAAAQDAAKLLGWLAGALINSFHDTPVPPASGPDTLLSFLVQGDFLSALFRWLPISTACPSSASCLISQLSRLLVAISKRSAADPSCSPAGIQLIRFYSHPDVLPHVQAFFKAGAFGPDICFGMILLVEICTGRVATPARHLLLPMPEVKQIALAWADKLLQQCSKGEDVSWSLDMLVRLVGAASQSGVHYHDLSLVFDQMPEEVVVMAKFVSPALAARLTSLLDTVVNSMKVQSSSIAGSDHPPPAAASTSKKSGKKAGRQSKKQSKAMAAGRSLPATQPQPPLTEQQVRDNKLKLRAVEIALRCAQHNANLGKHFMKKLKLLDWVEALDLRQQDKDVAHPLVLLVALCLTCVLRLGGLRQTASDMALAAACQLEVRARLRRGGLQQIYDWCNMSFEACNREWWNVQEILVGLYVTIIKETQEGVPIDHIIGIITGALAKGNPEPPPHEAETRSRLICSAMICLIRSPQLKDMDPQPVIQLAVAILDQYEALWGSAGALGMRTHSAAPRVLHAKLQYDPARTLRALRQAPGIMRVLATALRREGEEEEEDHVWGGHAAMLALKLLEAMLEAEMDTAEVVEVLGKEAVLVPLVETSVLRYDCRRGEVAEYCSLLESLMWVLEEVASRGLLTPGFARIVAGWKIPWTMVCWVGAHGRSDALLARWVAFGGAVGTLGGQGEEQGSRDGDAV